MTTDERKEIWLRRGRWRSFYLAFPSNHATGRYGGKCYVTMRWNNDGHPIIDINAPEHFQVRLTQGSGH